MIAVNLFQIELQMHSVFEDNGATFHAICCYAGFQIQDVFGV